ncbi:hypothetical protein CIP107503_01922 [Corynebacterium diphtheriae]|nr:hypothetical protein CIP107503_01922 [Corynebacterium diphtheriae]CAB0615003.1 hypothetical protein CIP107541_01961 [Corynebacterium diphtheriae]CAB0665713.1 hypothetical protein CIP107567_02091 [Corynebacterium diphtheriae]CAB0711391.1 hypothetical protein FRC0022_02037 [Corynebacterium diphtheriae]CAB0735087.1 hypothetical protein FRC0089_01932 [Corynebacterium diphtheriae]
MTVTWKQMAAMNRFKQGIVRLRANWVFDEFLIVSVA